MFTTDDIIAIVKLAEQNPALQKELQNLNAHEHRIERFYDTNAVLQREFPVLLGTYSPWGIDIHCMSLYRTAADKLGDSPGKQSVFLMMAETHCENIRSDFRLFEEYLHVAMNDYFGLGY